MSGSWQSFTLPQTSTLKLPRLVNCNATFSTAQWRSVSPRRPTIRCPTLMVSYLGRPYHHQSFSATARHQMFYPDGLLPGEALAPPVNEALLDFPTSCEWTPDRGPRKSFSAAKPATDATHAPLGGLTSPAMSILAPLTAKDTNMVDSKVTPLAHSQLPHSRPRVYRTGIVSNGGGCKDSH